MYVKALYAELPLYDDSRPRGLEGAWVFQSLSVSLLLLVCLGKFVVTFYAMSHFFYYLYFNLA